jgi:hypothetical protein
LGKLEPNLVGMLIGWFYKKSRFFVVDWKYKKEIKSPTFNGLKIDKGPYICEMNKIFFSENLDLID